MSLIFAHLTALRAAADVALPLPHIPRAGTQDAIDGDGGDNSLPGTEGDDSIHGLGGNDSCYGYGGADTIYGGSGNDNLYGGLDFDSLYGGAGDDLLQGVQYGVILTTGGPSDIIDGGDGIDTLVVDYTGFVNSGTSQPVAVTVNIATGAGEVQVDGFRGENFTSTERLTFSGPDGNDRITGGDYADVINGNGGSDILKAGKGDDSVGDSWGTIDADGGAGTDTLTLYGGVSGHTYADTVIDGGAGTVTIGGSPAGTFRNFENLTVWTGSGNDTIAGIAGGINTFYGASGNKTFHGQDMADHLSAGDGNDTFYGGGGNDWLAPGAGDNTVYGGGGDDTYYGGGTGWVYGGAGADNLNGAGDGVNFSGGAGDDIIFIYEPTASIGSQSFLGGTGKDDLVLYWTNASLDFTNATIDVEELRWVDYNHACNLTTTFTTAQFLAFDQIVLGTENRYDDDFRIVLADNAGVVLPEISQFMELQLADGGQRADLSGVGTDWVPWVTGGNGDDTVIAPTFAAIPYFVADLGGGDDVFAGGGINDRVNGGDGRDTLDGGAGNDRLVGGAGNDKIYGGQGNDHVDDILNGGPGADRLDGKSGHDTFVYKKAAESTGAHFDTIVHADFLDQDVLDVAPAISGINAAVTAGALSKATFDADLAAAVDGVHLGKSHAVLFTPDAGDYSGKTFLIVDLNATKGYQAGADLVIMLEKAANLAALDTADFI